MLTPDRALVALATAEDVFTPAGAAVVITAIRAVIVGRAAFYVAEVAPAGHPVPIEIPIDDLTVSRRRESRIANHDGGAE